MAMATNMATNNARQNSAISMVVNGECSSEVPHTSGSSGRKKPFETDPYMKALMTRIENATKAIKVVPDKTKSHLRGHWPD